MIMCIQNLVIFCLFVLKILNKNQILTSIKGRNSVANLRKTIFYNTNVDLVNDDVYTKFGLILSIRSQDIEQKPNSDVKLKVIHIDPEYPLPLHHLNNASKALTLRNKNTRRPMAL